MWKISQNYVLQFSANPDYEAPIDANTNNQYEITLNASDGVIPKAINADTK